MKRLYNNYFIFNIY